MSELPKATNPVDPYKETSESGDEARRPAQSQPTSSVPKNGNPNVGAAAEQATPTEATEASQQRVGKAKDGDTADYANPHIGDVLADPNTNGARRG